MRDSSANNASAPTDEVSRRLSLSLMGLLSGYLVHELNNILTPVGCYTELALANPSPALTAKALRLSADATRRARHLIDHYLGTARDVGADHSSDVKDAVVNAMRFLPRPVEEDGFEIEVNIRTTVRVAMRNDHLEQVILNLLLNARTSLRPKGGLISIDASASGSTGNESVSITVRDTGCGITDRLMEEVNRQLASIASDPNSRYPSEHRRVSRGLGLEICGGLIAEWGGRLSVAPASPHGTICQILLPAARPIVHSSQSAA